MQTFLPFESFTESAACLDNRRLGKQRVECKQILQAIQQGPYVMYDTVLSMQVFGMPITDSNIRYKKRKTAWYNHPATQMWKDSENQLAVYGAIICSEWIKRGFKDSLLGFFTLHTNGNHKQYMPLLGYPPFHISHQSNLVRKDSVHYRKWFPDVSSKLPYVWSLPE